MEIEIPSRFYLVSLNRLVCLIHPWALIALSYLLSMCYVINQLVALEESSNLIIDLLLFCLPPDRSIAIALSIE